MEDVAVPIDVYNCFEATPLLAQQDKGVGKGTLHLQDLVTSQLVKRKGRGRHCLQHAIIAKLIISGIV